ncbi:MAG: hypothetical protein HC897_04350 [Thermoanaerobaculia bacterium]|nr:hypothetical protein [Thermoanaerobaculia bacterium]
MELYLVVLCTNNAKKQPKHIVDEIRLAVHSKLSIIPIEFDRGAAEFLLSEAGFEDPGTIHRIDMVDPAGRYLVNERLEDALRRRLTYRARKWLEEHRLSTKEWAEKLCPDIFFWETTWREYFPFDSTKNRAVSVALTARGGSGKSVLIAHCIRDLLEDPEAYPVLVDEALLRCATSELPHHFGARSEAELSQQIEALAEKPTSEHRGWKPMHVVFVVDGLDRIVVPGDPTQSEIVDALNLLANCAPVLIGCRREAWDTWYGGRVSVTQKPVPELDVRDVRDLLRHRTRFDPSSFNPLLQVPFFLDIALENAGKWTSLPATETEFLRLIWTDALNEGSQARQPCRAIRVASGGSRISLLSS